MSGKLHLYISGPISNGEQLPVGSPERKANEEAFFRAEVSLLEKNHRVTNPLRLHVNHPNWNWARKLRLDIEYLVRCDGIFLLPGWNGSEGSTLERYIAGHLDMLIFYSLDEILTYTPSLVDGKL